MGKKKATDSKAAAKLQKKAKQDAKSTKAELKAVKGKGKAGGKNGAADADDDDLEAILASFQDEWKAQHTVTEEVQSGPPSRRVNASFTAVGDYLYLVGGEYFDGGKAYFYNDTYRYDPIKNEWRQYMSPNAPAPRSAHQVVVIPKEGGQLWLFGGEFASVNQTAFHHYKDLWVFSLSQHTWEKVETKNGPSARSGHRMAVWKQYIVLFGGFHDLGIRTNYLGDLWLFDIETYKWKNIEIRDTDRAPGPRSGFSMITTPDGVIVHGGYRKEYTKGSKPVGVALDDTWLLKMDADPTKLKWERKKKAGYAPSMRSGCSMTLWQSKGMGVLFGGVHDEEEEDDIKSVFYNDLYAYNLANNRWISLGLNKQKKRGGAKAKRKAQVIKDVELESKEADDSDDDVNMEMDAPKADYDEDDEEEMRDGDADLTPSSLAAQVEAMDIDGSTKPGSTSEEKEDRPIAPLERYNAMIAVLKNTLYVYGGIYETEKREYTLDDFYTLNLEKRAAWTTLRASGIDEEGWAGSDDEDDGEEEEEESSSDDEDGDDEEIEMQIDAAEEEEEDGGEAEHARLTAVEKEALRKKAQMFLGSAKDANRSEEETLSTPQPGESLRTFYQRSREHWVTKAYEESSNRGKLLRREAFGFCDAKYAEYKPILQEIERIQREAEVEAADKKDMSAGGKIGEGSRNRR